MQTISLESKAVGGGYRITLLSSLIAFPFSGRKNVRLVSVGRRICRWIRLKVPLSGRNYDLSISRNEVTSAKAICEAKF